MNEETKREGVHLEARGFSVFYGAHEAVCKVDLSVPCGLVTAIIGPSGCGKSTRQPAASATLAAGWRVNRSLV